MVGKLGELDSINRVGSLRPDIVGDCEGPVIASCDGVIAQIAGKHGGVRAVAAEQKVVRSVAFESIITRAANEHVFVEGAFKCVISKCASKKHVFAFGEAAVVETSIIKVEDLDAGDRVRPEYPPGIDNGDRIVRVYVKPDVGDWSVIEDEIDISSAIYRVVTCAAHKLIKSCAAVQRVIILAAIQTVVSVVTV